MLSPTWVEIAVCLRDDGVDQYLARVGIQVLEGALVEVPTAEVTGMDRRAFGEFVGPHGELARTRLVGLPVRIRTSPV